MKLLFESGGAKILAVLAQFAQLAVPYTFAFIELKVKLDALTVPLTVMPVVLTTIIFERFTFEVPLPIMNRSLLLALAELNRPITVW